MPTNDLKGSKLVLVLANFISISEKKTEKELEEIFCIWYFITMKDQIKALLDLKIKFNAKNQAFASQLNLKI